MKILGLDSSGLVASVAIVEDDVVVAFSFPQHFKNMPYFVPVASAVLRSQSSSPMAFYFGETV